MCRGIYLLPINLIPLKPEHNVVCTPHLRQLVQSVHSQLPVTSVIPRAKPSNFQATNKEHAFYLGEIENIQFLDKII